MIADRNATLERIVALEERYFEAKNNRESSNTYLAGHADRMNPMPRGIDPLGSGADYHYKSEHEYYLMVERGRAAVRNHPLVEQGIHRLIANLKLRFFKLDVNSGDPEVDQSQKDFWKSWTGETTAGRNDCDYEGTRTFSEIACQSFFNQVTCGDILHLPLYDGRLQTWESHNIRTPYGRRYTNDSRKSIVHGVEVFDDQVTAYHVTPRDLFPWQNLRSRWQSTRIPAFDFEGNKLAFWLGFRHRFRQRRGISRLSAPRDAMNGFDDLNYANIKSALRRSLISYLMEEVSSENKLQATFGRSGKESDALPQSGPRYAERHGTGVEIDVIEQAGEPAQIIKPPPGYNIKGWNADLPGGGFFEHSALLLTMLAVNLDLPLMFLLLDGSLVNFHGGRMTFDQAKLRFQELQDEQLKGLWNPVYEWKTRQRLDPDHPLFDRALAHAVKRGANPFAYKFRRPAWPYVKPLEDAATEDLAERRNLKSMHSILADRGVDLDEHIPEVIGGRGKFIRAAIREALGIQQDFPTVIANDELPRLWREVLYGNESTGVQLAISAESDGEVTPAKKKVETNE